MNKKLVESFVGFISAEFSMLALPALRKSFEMALKYHFEKIEKSDKITEFKKFRDEAKSAVKFDGLNTRQKNVFNVRLWRAGKIVGVKLGKTPIKTGKPPVKKSPPPVDGNGGSDSAVVLPEELFGKAPREKARGLKQVLSALMARTGWSKKELLAEVTAILK